MAGEDLKPFQGLKERARAACIMGRTRIGGVLQRHPQDCVECVVLLGLLQQTAYEARELISQQPRPTQKRDQVKHFKAALIERFTRFFDLPEYDGNWVTYESEPRREPKLLTGGVVRVEPHRRRE